MVLCCRWDRSGLAVPTASLARAEAFAEDGLLTLERGDFFTSRGLLVLIFGD